MSQPGAFTGYREEWDIEFPLLPPRPERVIPACDHPRPLHGMRREPYTGIVLYTTTCRDCGEQAATIDYV